MLLHPQGPPVKKLLYMTTPAVVDGQLLPHWRAALPPGAALMQAVPDMLEIVPQGAQPCG